MQRVGDRATRELLTLKTMLALYCQSAHGSTWCPECERLWQYAKGQVEACPFLRGKARKPTCRNCRIHCYQAEMRLRIKTVMRVAGPRMLFFHPLLTLRHLLSL